MASEPEVMLPAVPAPAPLTVRHELEVDELVAQVQKIQQVMERVMVEADPQKGIEGHYGKIPGTNKPTLFKAGAEKLCVVFRLRPEFDSEMLWDGLHLTVKSRCTLVHIPTGNVFGTGEGMCSTKESKYAYRGDGRQCPACGVSAIKKSKYPPKDKSLGREPGWYCFAKIGGCGVEFAAKDEAILSQPEGRAVNPDLPDLYNTVLKMSNKRAHTAAVLLSTAASDIFTQDLEDMPQAQAAAPKAKTPEQQREEVLALVYGFLRKQKLMSQGAADERRAAIKAAFNVDDWEDVKGLSDVKALQDGLTKLTDILMPGDGTVPFGDEPVRQSRGEK